MKRRTNNDIYAFLESMDLVSEQDFEDVRSKVDRIANILYGDPDGKEPGLLEIVRQLAKSQKAVTAYVRWLLLAIGAEIVVRVFNAVL